MRFLRSVVTASVAAFVMASAGAHAASSSNMKEDYIKAPMPPGFQVIITELEGPVFANAQGLTLYKWPKKANRNGDAGEIEYKPTCDGTIYRESSGLMSPYPPGLEMPEVDKRPACVDVWPPVLASADAKEVGKWKPTDRPDGRKQWTYDGWPLYTSILDKRPGEAFGGSVMFWKFDGGVTRIPVSPDPNVPAQFGVVTTMMGRLVTLKTGWSVYTYDGDSRNRSNCYNACLDGWQPVLAADYARATGEWAPFERAAGIRQWAFRGKPVYRYLGDSKTHSQDGADNPRWHNVYTQLAPPLPPGLALKDTGSGLVLGDSKGSTIYQYVCIDDGIDQLACDHPGAPQVHRFTICGGGDPDRCVKTFPYVIAPAGAKSGTTTWGTALINTKTGKWAKTGDADALNVWTFRGRPVYTFAGRNGYGDKTAMDTNAQNWGEFTGWRNGFQMMIYRDLFMMRDE